MRVVRHMRCAMTMSIIFLFSCVVAVRSEACYQLAPEVLHIKASSLEGRATRDGKASSAIYLRLQRVRSFDRYEGRKFGETQAIKWAITALDGSFSFRDVAPGHYWLIVDAGGFGRFPVDVEFSESENSHARLSYKYFADGCETLTAEGGLNQLQQSAPEKWDKMNGGCGVFEYVEHIPDAKLNNTYSDRRKALPDVVLDLYPWEEGKDCCEGKTSAAQDVTDKKGKFKFDALTPGKYWIVARWNLKDYRKRVKFESVKAADARCAEQGFSIDNDGKFEEWVTITVE